MNSPSLTALPLSPAGHRLTVLPPASQKYLVSSGGSSSPLVFTEVEAAIEETATANPLFGQELK